MVGGFKRHGLLTVGRFLLKPSKSAGVAQLVEHPICNRAVGSSSLSTSTILPITSCANQLNCKQIACLQVIGDVQIEKHI